MQGKYSIRLFLLFVLLTGTLGAPCLVIAQSSAMPGSSPSPVQDTQVTTPEKINGVPSIAPDYRSDDRDLPALGRVGVDMLEQRPLTMREALELALENNKDIEVSRQNVKIAEFDLQAAGGAYEPRFTGGSFYDRAVAPTNSIFNGGRLTTAQSSINSSLRFEGLMKKHGGSYRAEFLTSRVNTDSPVSALSPQNNASFGLSFTQPLKRGRGFDQQRRIVEISKKNLSLSDSLFRQRTIEVISAAQRAYWDLTFALRNLQVQRDAARDAKEQVEHFKRLVEEGAIAPIDVVASETQVANFELAVYDALETVNRSENALKNLLAKNRGDAIWGVSLIPSDRVELDAPPVSLPEAVQAALSNRPELQLNETAQEINEIDQKFYKEQTKSQIDFVASYTSSGLSGNANPNRLPNFQTGQLSPVPPKLTGSYTSALSDVFVNRYPTFRVGVQFNLPLGNKTAAAQLGKSLAEKTRLETQREQIEQQIQVDVRNALQSLRTAEARLRAAAIARENSEKQYDSEKRKLDEGQSTVYLVLERQTALAAARGNELRAQTELNKAVTELQRATGNSLRANNINFRGERREVITRLVK